MIVTFFHAAVAYSALGDCVAGGLFLAPAMGCLLPFYKENLLRLKKMGRMQEVEKLEREE